MVVGKQSVKPETDVLARSFKGDRVALFRRVELSTVTAVSAVGCLSHLVQGRTVLALGGPLPRVFGTVRKESIRALDVKPTLVDCSLKGSGKSIHVESREGSLTHFRPVTEL